MDETPQVTVNWYIIFKKSPLKHWVFRWLDSEIQHCYAVRESDGGQFWIIVNSMSSHTDVRIESKLEYPHIRLLEPDSVVLSIKAIIDGNAYRHTLCIFNCVEVVKSLLGIRAFWCWTPKNLHDRLVNNAKSNRIEKPAELLP